LAGSRFVEEAKRKPGPIGMAWFDYPEDKIPMALQNYAIGMEIYGYGRRTKNSVMYRLVTGEDPPITLGMWMSRKAATASSGFGSNYTKPYSNIISNGCSVLENRIGTVVPFVQVEPTDVSFEVRSACFDLTLGLDAIFDQNNFRAQCRLGFRDKFTWGMRVSKVTPDENEKQVKISRILIDNLIIDEISAAAGLPDTNIVERVFMSRSNAFAAWGGKDPKIDAAIRSAPTVFVNNYMSAVQNDFIAVLEGYALPQPQGDDREDKPGLHVLCLNNVHLRPPKAWKRKRLPYAVERWEPQQMGFYSPGGAFKMSPYQMQVSNLTEQINAAIRAVAYPRWLAQKGSSVTAQSMGARPGAVHFWAGSEPKPIVPTAVNAELYNERDAWENKGYAAIGLTQQQVQGQKQPGVNAGVALRMMVNIEDSRNKALLLDSEQHAAEVAELVIDVAEEINPKIMTAELPSRSFNWNDVKLAREQRKVQAFPISSLPAMPEGKAQQIADWYADGDIDSRVKFRLQALPDLASFSKLKTASDDLVESTLDEIVKTQRFVPPEPTYESLAVALKAAQARYNLEKRYKSPRKVMRALQQYMAAITDMINHPEGVTLAPPEPAVTAPSDLPVGTLPAPPPLQVAPTMAPPMRPALAA
jgi:hypothetical protein